MEALSPPTFRGIIVEGGPTRSAIFITRQTAVITVRSLQIPSSTGSGSHYRVCLRCISAAAVVPLSRSIPSSAETLLAIFPAAQTEWAAPPAPA